MPAPVDLMILAGEPSGDAHGQQLIQELFATHPDLKIAVVGGEKMRSQPVELLFPMEKLCAMGFFDLLPALPRLAYYFYNLRRLIIERSPKAVVCIDYPGFHLRLQNSLRKGGYQGKLIHYICPSVWAWSKGRIRLMEQNLDLLLTIFPFEVSLFATTSLQTVYVGNPSFKELAKKCKKPYSLDRSSRTTKTIGIFPGSRKKEIRRNLPWQIAAAQEFDAVPIVSCAEEKMLPFLHSLLGKISPSIKIVPPEKRHELMQSVDCAYATSCTDTLELALCNTPTVVTFAIATRDYLLATKILGIDLPFYCIVNILQNEEVFPELFGPNLTKARIKYFTRHWLANEEKLEKCRKQLRLLHSCLETTQSTASKEILLEIGL